MHNYFTATPDKIVVNWLNKDCCLIGSIFDFIFCKAAMREAWVSPERSWERAVRDISAWHNSCYVQYMYMTPHHPYLPVNFGKSLNADKMGFADIWLTCATRVNISMVNARPSGVSKERLRRALKRSYQYMECEYGWHQSYLVTSITVTSYHITSHHMTISYHNT